MTFDKVVKHVRDHGFITRASWNAGLVLCFGMDNVMHGYYSDGRKEMHHMSLASMKADDWMILPYFWEGSEDDFRPYRPDDDNKYQSPRWMDFVSTFEDRELKTRAQRR
jgi:hypothetical protein